MTSKQIICRDNLILFDFDIHLVNWLYDIIENKTLESY